MTAPTATNPKQDLGQFFDGYAEEWQQFYQSDVPDGRSFDYRNRQSTAFDLVARYLKPSAKVLEMGCGAGFTACELAERGYQMTCVDISPKMIEATQMLFAKRSQSAEFYVGTLHEAPCQPASFDGILALGVMDYVPDTEATLRRIHDLLKPGGVCILSYTNGGSILPVVEYPIKYVIGSMMHFATRRDKWVGIADRKSTLHRRSQIEGIYRSVGLQPVETQHFSYGFRLGRFWFPPLAIVRRWEKLWRNSSLNGLGRGFFAVARRPVEGATAK